MCTVPSRKVEGIRNRGFHNILPEMSSFQQEIGRHEKTQESEPLTRGKPDSAHLREGPCAASLGTARKAAMETVLKEPSPAAREERGILPRPPLCLSFGGACSPGLATHLPACPCLPPAANPVSGVLSAAWTGAWCGTDF